MPALHPHILRVPAWPCSPAFPVFVLQGSAPLPPLPGSPQGALPPLYLPCVHWHLSSFLYSNLSFLKSHLFSYIPHSKVSISCSSCREHRCCPSLALTPCSDAVPSTSCGFISLHNRYRDSPILPRKIWGSKKVSH